jgi:hypothetical protein
MTEKEKEFAIGWILVWQTECAGGCTKYFLCSKKNTMCDKKDKLLCQKGMKKIMKSLGYKTK